VSVWQSLYEELNDPNFVIISAAQDTGGEAVAGPIFDQAKASYVQIVDVNHRISSVFNFVNVPSAAWIDESGRIVRIDEGTYAKSYPFGGTDKYAPAVKDWVEKGSDSQYVQSAATVSGNIRRPTPEQLRAEPAFRMGNYFRQQGHGEQAETYWQLAKELNPDSVNFIRQDLTLSAEGSAGQSFFSMIKERSDRGLDYYRPLDLEEK
jgi:hypothetical protein